MKVSALDKPTLVVLHNISLHNWKSTIKDLLAMQTKKFKNLKYHYVPLLLISPS